jgi:DNA-binding response OmpR family regulator
MHILIVEDDKKTADFVSGAFKQSGYTMTCCEDGESGAAAAINGSYDIAIIDIMLPKKDGLTIIREIRNSGSSLPIIVLSARGSVDARIQGLESGADDYISKPFSIAELLARVQTVMRRVSQSESSTVLKVDDLEMDLISHKVTRNGRKIELQPLEYQLLEYLMRNKGRVVTKNTILERVWDYDFDPHTNVVEARVYKLREKIEREGEKRLITTIRGFGYVLGA